MVFIPINGNLRFKQVGYSFSNINVPAQSHVNRAITSECRIDGYTLISAVVHFSTTSAAALSATYHIFAASQFFITFINNSGGTQNCSGSVYLYYINNAIKEDIFK